MDKLGRESLLYDFYGELLTKRQQDISHLVKKGVTSSEEALEAYESKLGLVDKYLNDRKDVLKIRELADTIRQSGDLSLLDEIILLSERIEER